MSKNMKSLTFKRFFLKILCQIDEILRRNSQFHQKKLKK